VFCVFLCCSVFLFLCGPFCHGVLKPDMSAYARRQQEKHVFEKILFKCITRPASVVSLWYKYFTRFSKIKCLHYIIYSFNMMAMTYFTVPGQTARGGCYHDAAKSGNCSGLPVAGDRTSGVWQVQFY